MITDPKKILHIVRNEPELICEIAPEYAVVGLYPEEITTINIPNMPIKTTTLKNLLAFEFKKVLQEWLTKEEIDEIVRRNKKEKHPSVCHSHDFCDANEAMAEAMINIGIDPNIHDEENGMDDDIQHLWNSAWSTAKEENFKL